MTNTPIDFESLFSSLPGYVFWKDSSSRYMACNDNFANLLGRQNKSEIQGLTDYDFGWSRKLASKLIQDDQVVLKKSQSSSNEYCLDLIRSDGNQLIIRLDRQSLCDDKGKVIGLLGTAFDITDNKLAERAAEATNHFAEDILYNLPGLIYWKNSKSQYIVFNKNVVTLSGLTREELLGKTDNELNWGMNQAKEFQEDDMEIMESGIPKVTEHEIPIKRADGKNIFVRTEKSRLHDRTGKIAGILGVALDITDQKDLEEKLIKESQAKTEFIRNMEHDIRTPLGGMYSVLSILEKNEKIGEKKELLSMTGLAAKELLDYCNDIIDISRLEGGTFPLISKKFNLKDLIYSVIQMESPAAKVKNLQLEVDYPEEIPSILLGDQYRIQRILINLVSNSVKFTKTGFIRVIVRIAKPKNKKNIIILSISVKDTGIGIPKDKQSEIFKKFSRLIPSSKGLYRGTGLGLNVIKQLVDELDGEIDLESSPEMGSTFVFILPFKLPLVDKTFFKEGESE